ncbi:hypothetical protein KDK77_08935, partial [bacterium]|nr:hypothetical protein [bacterium]
GQLKIETLASSSAFALFFNGGTLDVSTLPNSSIPFETVNLGYTSASNISMNDTDYNFDSVLNLNIGYEGTGFFVQKTKDMVNHNLKLAIAVKGNTGGGTTPKGTYTLENKNLTIKSLVVGKDGIGTFNQSGNVEVGDSIALGGDSPDSHGEYNLESGSLTAGEIFVGKNGTGIFNQNGVVSLTGSIKISNGEYNQNFGMLSAYSISISNGIFNQFDTVALTSGITLNGGKYNWNAGGLIANSITVGQYGTGIFNQSDTLTLGGEIILGFNQSGFGTYNQNTGAFTAKKITVGDAGTGIFNQFDNVSVIGSEKGEAQVIVGTSLGGFGTYNQNTGALTAKKITVGVAGTGIFNQSDTVSVTGEINDGESQVILGETPGSSGTYNLDSGNLTADTMLLGLEGKGTFIQNTGLVQASGSLGFMALGVVGGSNGTYAMLNGSLSNFFSIQVGRTGGNGIFEHIGGTVDTVDRLFIGFHGGTGYYKLGMNPGDSSIESIRQMQVANPNPVLDLKNLYIGYSLFNSEESNGTFSLFEGGTLNAQNTVIGVKETAKGDEESSTAVSQGQFNLNGGSHITKVLAIGSDQGSGTYNVNGGKLNVRQADLGVLGTNNEFNINSNSADITVLEYFSLGENLTFSAVAVSSITMMSETTFTFRATDQNALAGLNNLDLIIAGENVRLEIGSQDFGAIVEGFNLNFALNALMFSGDGIRSLLLENNFDNQPEFDDEAFYVKDIIADDTVQQATIDGGGSITVYYMNKQGNISFTNGTFIQVPAEEETSFGFSPLSLSRGVLPITPFTNSVPDASVYWLTFSGVLLLLRYIKQNV